MKLLQTHILISFLYKNRTKAKRINTVTAVHHEMNNDISSEYNKITMTDSNNDKDIKKCSQLKGI
jgi:hypothetical protein